MDNGQTPMAVDSSHDWREPLWVKPLCCIVLLLVGWLPGACGYTPRDDALRHTAFVLSDRSWAEILLLREEVFPGFDSHPGWHWLGRRWGALTGLDRWAMLHASMVAAFLFAWAPATCLLRRPVWLLVVLAGYAWLEPDIWRRFFLGRPFLAATGAGLVYLLLWDRPGRWRLPGLASAAALHVWIHPNWYLLALPAGAILLAGLLQGRWRESLSSGVALGAGVVLGMILTGHPGELMVYYLRHAWWALGEASGTPALVTEFQGRAVPWWAVGVLSLGLAGRWLCSPEWRPHPSHPAWILGVGGLLGGLAVSRFWTDWGLPATLLWLALELGGKPWPRIPFLNPARIPAGHPLLPLVATCFALWSATQVAWPGWQPWETRLIQAEIVQAVAESPDCLPGPGGIVYNDHLSVFYQFFLAFPDADWRYAVGFEPGMAPSEIRAHWGNLQGGRGWSAYQAWISRLRPPDRLVISSPRLSLAMLQRHPVTARCRWFFIPPWFWVGRIDSVQPGSATPCPVDVDSDRPSTQAEPVDAPAAR